MLILNLMTVVHLRMLGQAVHSHMHALWVHKHLGTQETSCHKSKETLKFWTLHSQPSNRQSCLTSVFTQGLKGSRTWGWWITGRWFRQLFCQQRREDSVRARAEEWLDYPDILGGTGGAVAGGQAGKFPPFLSQCTQTSLEIPGKTSVAGQWLNRYADWSQSERFGSSGS